MQLNPASLVFFLAATVSAWLVVLAWGRRNEPAGPPLISLLVFEGLWALCEAIEVVLLDPSAQAVMYRLKLSSVALVPPSLLFFVLEYTSRTGAAPPRFKVLILAVPAISISLIATSGEHRLFLTGMEQVEIQGYRLLQSHIRPCILDPHQLLLCPFVPVRMAARPLSPGTRWGLEEADAVLVRMPTHTLGHQRGGPAQGSSHYPTENMTSRQPPSS